MADMQSARTVGELKRLLATFPDDAKIVPSSNHDTSSSSFQGIGVSPFGQDKIGLNWSNAQST